MRAYVIGVPRVMNTWDSDRAAVISLSGEVDGDIYKDSHCLADTEKP